MWLTDLFQAGRLMAAGIEGNLPQREAGENQPVERGRRHCGSVGTGKTAGARSVLGGILPVHQECRTPGACLV